MTRKVALIFYLFILVTLALISSLVSYVNDSLNLFILEITVDLALIAGVFLYIKGYLLKWWRIVLIGAVFGECYLLFIDSRVELLEVFIWVLVLLPAVVFNLKVTGMIQSIKSKGKTQVPEY